jgi:hypothetical protein
LRLLTCGYDKPYDRIRIPIMNRGSKPDRLVIGHLRKKLNTITKTSNPATELIKTMNKIHARIRDCIFPLNFAATRIERGKSEANANETVQGARKRTLFHSKGVTPRAKVDSGNRRSRMVSNDERT